MCCGVTDKLLVIRLGPEGAQAALTEPHTRPMDFTGKPMKSMIYVESTGVDSQVDLNKWIQRACDFAKTLPPK